MAEQPDNLVLEHLCGPRAETKAMREEMFTKADLNGLRGGLKGEIHSSRTDVASNLLNVSKDIAGLRKVTREQIVGVRRVLIEYPSPVVGQGMQIIERQDRVRRIAQQLNLPPLGAR